VDAVAVEDLLADARAALRDGDPAAALDSATQALELFRGRALHGLPDSDWICAEAGRLDSLRVDALEEQFDAALALGRHAEIVSSIQSAVDESPYRERLHGQLMLALYRCGRQADALQAFRHARRVLDEELGLEPGPELRRLERAILAQDGSIDLPVDEPFPVDRPAADPHAVLQLMRAHLRRAEELYEQALAAVAVTA
jgi:DNA-binding SARP family transcriptional activator